MMGMPPATLASVASRYSLARVAGAPARSLRGSYWGYPEAGLAVLKRRLPHQTLARLFLLNERIGPDEILAAGLVARVVPTGEALDTAVGMVSRVGSLDRGTVTDTKHRL